MSITIVAAGEGDIGAVVDLLEATERFYGLTEFAPRDQRELMVRAALFDAPASASILIARAGDEPVGLASYSFLWPAADLTRSLFLKELFVTDGHRRDGVGRLLMRALGEVAIRTGCSRVEWQTDTSNSAAQAFYSSLGVPVDDSKVFYRVRGANFERLTGLGD